jgi:hypothetical protein
MKERSYAKGVALTQGKKQIRAADFHSGPLEFALAALSQ